MVNGDLPDVANCYVTTKGRVTGRPHEIEIWYGLRGRTVYLLSGGGPRSDWVRNMDAEPTVTVRIEEVTYDGAARRVTDADEDLFARRALAAKYQGWIPDREMSDWARNALCIAIDLRERG